MTETDPKPRVLNAVDDELRDRLQAMLSAIDHVVPYLEAGCKPGSDFFDDYQLFTSRSSYEAASLLLWNVLDHLRFVAKGVLGGDRLTPFAPFTVVRSALTAVTLASWMLSRDTDERRFRTLVVTFEELRNKKNTVAIIAEAPDRTDVPDVADYDARRDAARRELRVLEGEIAKVSADATTFGVTMRAVKDGKPNDSKIVELGAEAATNTRDYYNDFTRATETLLVWKMLSSHAHGFSWAAQMTSTVTKDSDGREFNAFDPQSVDLLTGTQVVWDLITDVLENFCILAGHTRTSEADA